MSYSLKLTFLKNKNSRYNDPNTWCIWIKWRNPNWWNIRTYTVNWGFNFQFWVFYITSRPSTLYDSFWIDISFDIQFHTHFFGAFQVLFGFLTAKDNLWSNFKHFFYQSVCSHQLICQAKFCEWTIDHHVLVLLRSATI